MLKKLLTTLIVIVVVIAFGYANDIQVSNVILRNQSIVNHTVDIQFDISWQNSWRVQTAPNNYDAAWVFVKFKDASGNWKHATLSGQGTDHTPAAGAAIDAVSDGKGIFIYRSSTGTGTFSAAGNQILWKYGDDGLADADQVTIKVFALEMVYVPQGSFYAGSDTTNAGDINALMVVGTGSAQPFLVGTSLVSSVKSEGTGISDSQDDDVLKAINGNTGIGIDGDGGLDSDNDGSIDNSAFPTGYDDFYIMKYEVSQIQYAEFLNTLTRTQQNARTASQTADYYAMSGATSVSYRSAIRVPSSPGTGVITFGCDLDGDATFNETNDGTAIAANFLSWPDISAYLDWAALRPYSELEFAKASRGPSSVNAGEFVWGNTSYQTENYSGLTNAGYESELTASATANVHLAPQGIGGPIRVGSFAESSTSRSQAGAGYYGAMDLAGNLWEIVIPLGNSTGRAYTANHGDGALTSAGNADVNGWPSSTSTAQLGKRGGPFLGSANEGRIANRNYANRSFYTTQHKEFDGCRGARSAPEN